MLTIIKGKFKGKKIKVKKSIRPTLSKQREALFNISQNKIKNSYFLDLFAGSGIVGLEALSRGAKFVFFIEKDKKAAENIRENIVSLDVKKDSKVIALDVFYALKRIKETFDIIYIDPPYKLYSNKNFYFLEKILHSLKDNKLLKKDSYIFVECPLNIKIREISNFFLIKKRKYGSCLLLQYMKK